MTNSDRIAIIERFVKQNQEGYDSGHDWLHIERVRRIAIYINSIEKLADPFIVEVTALLHDMADSKFAGKYQEERYSLVVDLLGRCELSEQTGKILNVIRNISFSKKIKEGDLLNPLLFVVQDADRLDAIGAIGIARAFAYGGFRNNPIYIPGENNINNPSTIGHFHEKLLKLKDMMKTNTGSTIAIRRHQVLLDFLDEFNRELDGG